MDLSPLIKEIGRGASGAKALPVGEAERLFGAMLDGTVPELELGAILIALRMKGETLDELEGFLRAARQRQRVLVRAPDSPRPIIVPSYNGARRGANLTPLLALLLARLSLPVVVHGPEQVPGRVGTLEILAAMGFAAATTQDAQAAGRAGSRSGALQVFSTPALFPSLDRLMALRGRLGLRNAAHSLVKMIDPADGEGVILSAATHPPYLELASRLIARVQGHALVFRATEGEPYFNPKRSPTVTAVRHGTISTVLTADTASLDSLPDLPSDNTLPTTVDWTEAVLAGQRPVPVPLLDQLACCWMMATGLASFAEAQQEVRLRLFEAGIRHD